MIDWNKDIIGNEKIASNLDMKWTRQEARESKKNGLTEEEAFDAMDLNAMLDDYSKDFKTDKETIKQIIKEEYSK